MKFCVQCGFLDQANRMKRRHWKNEHPKVNLRKFGFVKDGGLPRDSKEEFKLSYKQKTKTEYEEAAMKLKTVPVETA